MPELDEVIRPMQRQWKPGPAGVPVVAPFEELCGWLYDLKGKPGLSLEDCKMTPDLLYTVAAVYRDDEGNPIGLCHVKLIDRYPELCTVIVHPDHRHQGIAREIVIFLARHGFDLRSMGSAYYGPMTPEGKGFATSIIAHADATYGQVHEPNKDPDHG